MRRNTALRSVFFQSHTSVYAPSRILARLVLLASPKFRISILLNYERKIFIKTRRYLQALLRAVGKTERPRGNFGYLALDKDGKSVMFAAADGVILSVDAEAKKITVNGKRFKEVSV